jgi:hypothetical protein
MPQEVKVWAVNNGGKPEELTQSKLDFESRLEEWLAHDIGLLDPHLLVFGRQVATDFGGRIDLLCLDPIGQLVIVELKRDKTPRDIVAQALDYASWAAELPSSRIEDIALMYLGDSLERAFERRFGIPLPETVNGDHKVIVVAAHVDAGSERIIRYLSEHHGVNINAVTFQYFRTSPTSEMLCRVFLVTPSEVEYRSNTRSGGKRRPNLTLDDHARTADDRGVGDEFRAIVKTLRPVVGNVRTTLSTVNFVGQWAPEKNGAIINLVPEDSSAELGVRFQVYGRRLASLLRLDEAHVARVLPASSEFWSFDSKGDPEWEGFAGFMRLDDADRIVDIIRERTAGADAV